MQKPKFLINLQREATDNPIIALGVGAAVATAAAKLIDATSAVQGRRAYNRNSKVYAKKNKTGK